MLCGFYAAHFSFCLGLYILHTPVSPQYAALNVICAVLCVVLPLSAVVLLQVAQQDGFGEFLSHFRDVDRPRRQHYSLHVAFKFVAGLLLAVLNDVDEGIVVVFFVAVVYVLNVLGNRPYAECYQTYRSASVHLLYLWPLFQTMYLRSMKSNMPIVERAKLIWPAYPTLVSLFLSILVTFVTVMTEFIQFCKKAKIHTVSP